MLHLLTLCKLRMKWWIVLHSLTDLVQLWNPVIDRKPCQKQVCTSVWLFLHSQKQLPQQCLHLECATVMTLFETGDMARSRCRTSPAWGFYYVFRPVLHFGVSWPPGRWFPPLLCVEMGQLSLRDSLASVTFVWNLHFGQVLFAKETQGCDAVFC